MGPFKIFPIKKKIAYSPLDIEQEFLRRIIIQWKNIKNLATSEYWYIYFPYYVYLNI